MPERAPRPQERPQTELQQPPPEDVQDGFQAPQAAQERRLTAPQKPKTAQEGPRRQPIMPNTVHYSSSLPRVCLGAGAYGAPPGAQEGPRRRRKSACGSISLQRFAAVLGRVKCFQGPMTEPQYSRKRRPRRPPGPKKSASKQPKRIPRVPQRTSKTASREPRWPRSAASQPKKAPRRPMRVPGGSQ